MKRFRHYRSVSLAILVLLAMLAGGALASNEQPATASNEPIPDIDLQAAIATLTESQRATLREFPRIDFLAIDANGAPSYVFGDLGRIAGSDAASALKFLEGMNPLLNARGNDSYDHVSTEVDRIGQEHFRFQQRINGLLVKGAVMIVHVAQATGRIIGLNGHIATGEVEAMARLGASSAFASAIADMNSNGYGQNKVAPRVKARPLDEPTLAYVLTQEGNARLAWRARFDLESEAGTEANTLYVDASTGELLLLENQVYDAIDREVYNFGIQDWKNKPAIPGEIIFKEWGNIDMADSATKAVYPKLATVYNWLKNRFNRNSFDGRDAKMKVSVHVPFGLSLWMGEHQAAFFMDATDTHDSPTKSLDTVAHEFGHGVNLSSAHLLINTLEAGNLVEAFSDIMGACVEAYERGYTGGSTDEATLHKVWSIGEDWWTLNDPSKPLRSLRNPKSCNDDQNKYVDYYPELSGATSHEGSTVASLAFYLLAEGGQHPRNMTDVQVYGLGIPKAEQIFYRALTAYLTPFATFSDIRQCTHQAARDLYGSKSLEQAQVWYCWEAVGVPNVNLPSAREIGNGESIDPSLDRPGWQYFMLRVPSGQGKLEVVASGGFGDADIYVKRGVVPTQTNFDQASAGQGVAKSVRINNPLAGSWYIAINVRTPIGFSSLVARYSRSSGHVRFYEKENNNSLAKANRIIGSNTTVVGRLNKYPDTNEPTFIDNDFFRISVPAGKTVFITMTCPPGYAYKTSVLDANGIVLVEEAETLGSGDGKFKAIAFNNPETTAKVIYAKVVPTDWNFSKIRFHCDPTKDYYLDITW